MYKDKIKSLPLWNFESLNDFSSIDHYVSGRQGGESKDIFSSLNLSFSVNDHPDAVQANRMKIQEALKAEKLIFPKQTHSSNVAVISTGDEDLADTDALITNQLGICISVMSADCVPIILFDPVKKAVAAIHSGWRGTVAKISVRTIEAMKREFGTISSDLIACIGPSISQQNYEVGEEVVAEVDKVFGKDAGIVNRKSAQKGNIDLWKANKILLTDCGIRESNIEVSAICTYANDHEFFSARKSGNRTGRFAAGIMLQ